MGISGYTASPLCSEQNCLAVLELQSEAVLVSQGRVYGFQLLFRKQDELIHTDAAKRKGIGVIKRFSGGGTVVVDHNTVFATLIMQAEAVPGVECYPRPVMKWSEGFYKPVFSPHGPFRLQEHGRAAITDHSAHGMLAVAVMAETI